jgi:exocyst complex component 7
MFGRSTSSTTPSLTPTTTSTPLDLLSHYFGDVLQTLLDTLESRSKILSTSGRVKAGFTSIFLLNNLSYVRREIFNSNIGDTLPESSQDELNKRVRSAKLSYLEIWAPLISALMDPAEERGLMKAGLGAVGVGK